MVICIAEGCRNSSTRGFLMKRIPRDLERRAEWRKRINRRNWIPTDNSYICEVHFEDDHWEKNRLDRLKCNAVPTIFYKRLNYIKRKERHSASSSLQPDIEYRLVARGDVSADYEPAHYNFEKIDLANYLAVMNAAPDRIDKSGIHEGFKKEKTFKMEMQMEDSEVIQYPPGLKDDEKDVIISELKTQLTEKNGVILKYEKMICQMNSHFDKLKRRLRYWRNFTNKNRSSSRKPRKMRKAYAA